MVSIRKKTNFNVTMTPSSLKKTADKILFEYKITTGKRQSFTIRPFTMILVDKKYTGKVQTLNLQII